MERLNICRQSFANWRSLAPQIHLKPLKTPVRPQMAGRARSYYLRCWKLDDVSSSLHTYSRLPPVFQTSCTSSTWTPSQPPFTNHDRICIHPFAHPYAHHPYPGTLIAPSPFIRPIYSRSLKLSSSCSPVRQVVATRWRAGRRKVGVYTRGTIFPPRSKVPSLSLRTQEVR